MLYVDLSDDQPVAKLLDQSVSVPVQSTKNKDINQHTGPGQGSTHAAQRHGSSGVTLSSITINGVVFMTISMHLSLIRAAYT